PLGGEPAPPSRPPPPPPCPRSDRLAPRALGHALPEHGSDLRVDGPSLPDRRVGRLEVGERPPLPDAVIGGLAGGRVAGGGLCAGRDEPRAHAGVVAARAARAAGLRCETRPEGCEVCERGAMSCHGNGSEGARPYHACRNAPPPRRRFGPPASGGGARQRARR